MSSVQPTLCDLLECGISETIRVRGDLNVLRAAIGLPVVFLLDETHGLTDCINENVANAHELIQKCGVTLIGVESEFGGDTWDIELECYNRDREKTTMELLLPEYGELEFDSGDSLLHANNCPKFGDDVRLHGVNVVGVECKGLSEALECDHVVTQTPIRDHPLNLKRSEHFLRALFDLQRHHGLIGNLILNVGGNHNTHIEGWIRDGTVDKKAGQIAAYVRVTAPSYSEF